MNPSQFRVRYIICLLLNRLILVFAYTTREVTKLVMYYNFFLRYSCQHYLFSDVQIIKHYSHSCWMYSIISRTWDEYDRDAYHGDADHHTPAERACKDGNRSIPDEIEDRVLLKRRRPSFQLKVPFHARIPHQLVNICVFQEERLGCLSTSRGPVNGIDSCSCTFKL
jgi:hypothetical protein